MPPESKAPRALSIEKLVTILESKLEDEHLVLSALIQALGRGELPPGIWGQLHEAAQRDDRLLELASAYDELSQPRMIRRMTGPQQGELLLHAAEFLHGALEDAEGAVAYLERAVALDPGSKTAFDLLENLLIEAGNGSKLCELYVNIAAHQPSKEEQARLLRRAAELAEVFGEETPKVIAIHEKLLKVEPGDTEARRGLEGLYRRAARWGELAKLLEQGLTVDGASERELRAKLIELYLGELQQPDRAIGHVEELLKQDATSEPAREGARKLLSHKMLGARAALALESAHEREGEVGEVVRVLGVLIEATRGPQRSEAQKRLGRALLRSGNESEAFAVLEKVVASDASDDELRGSFRQAGEALGRQADVARVLLRASSATKNEALKARLNLEGAEALLVVGEARKARSPLQAALEGGEAPVQLQALRLLEGVVADDPKALAEVRERLVAAEPEADDRAAASARLGEAWQAVGDVARALAAWKGALSGPTRDRAEAALLALYEQSGAWGELVALLEEQGQRGDGPEAQARWERAARLRSERLGDASGSLEAWGRIAERFGRSPEVSRYRRELLDKTGRHAELVSELIEESASGSEGARGELWGLVAQLRSERLGDAAGSLAAVLSALRLVPGEARAAAVAARLLADPAQRLSAAEALIPVYREQADFWGLVRALEAQGASAPDAATRLAALGEAVELVASDEPARALQMASDGLRLSVAEELAAVPDWLVRMELLSGTMSGPSEHASVLLGALGDRALGHPALVDLARRAANSLAEAGQSEEALAQLARVFAADPSMVSGAPAVDRVLGARGDSAGRVALWREVLTHEKDPGRRADALRLLSSIERQRGRMQASVEALHEVLALVPGDQEARGALVEGLRALGRKEDLAEELDKVAQGLAGPARRQVLDELAPLWFALGQRARAAALYREMMDGEALTASQLSEAEQAAEATGDAALQVRALRGRSERAAGDERATLLAKLGPMLGPDEAREVWKQAARLRAGLGQADEARRLYQRALDLGDDAEAIEELLTIERAAGDDAAQEALLLRKLRRAASADEEVEGLIALAAVVARASRLDVFEEASASPRHPWSAEQRRRLLEVRTAALGADPARRSQAAQAHRALIESARSPEAVASFEAFLAAGPRDDAWRQDRRWLLSFQAEHSAEPAAALLAWAQEEEQELGDQVAAVELYRRLLVLDPASDAAQQRLAPLLLRLGDPEGARGVLLAQRSRATGPERRRLDLALASLLVDPLRRLDEALGALWPLFEANPADAEALAIALRVLAGAAGAEHAATQRAVTETLERAVASSQDDAQALGLLSSLLESGGGTAAQRRGWYEAMVARTQGDPEQALRVALRAVAEAPQEAALWEQAEQLARRIDRPTEVIEAYRLHLSNPAVAASIGQRAIDFHEEWFDDPEGVVALVERVLIADVGAQWAFDRLKVSYGADERWGELLSLYDRMIEAARSDHDRVVFLEDAAQIAKDFASDDGRAIGYLERLSELRRDDEGLIASLERLYERTGRYTSLIELLTRQLPPLSAADAQRMRARIAALWLDGVNDVGLSFGVIEKMLALNPEEPEAIALLERLLATFRRPAPGEATAPSSAAAYQQAAALLKVRYQEAGRFKDLVRVLEVELEGVSNDTGRAEGLRRLIALRLDPVGDREGAFADTVALLSLEPEDEAALRGLGALADQLGAHERQVSSLVELARARQGKAAATLWLESARVAAGKLNDRERAIAWFQEAIEQGRTVSGAALAASRELSALLASEPGKEDVRFRALSDQAALEPEAESRRGVIASMAALAREVLKAPERLAQAWLLRLKDDDDDLDALSGLIDAYRELGNWSELVRVLRLRAAVGEDAARQRSDLLAAALVQGEQLADLAGALEIWGEIRRRFGDDDQTTDATGELLQRLGRFDDLAALLETQAQKAQGAPRQAALLRWLGDIERQHRGHLLEAVVAYTEALGRDPSSAGALEGLNALTRDPEARELAVQSLLDHHRAAGEWAGVVGLLELRLSLAQGDEAQAAILVETAGLLEARGRDVGGAFGALRRALALRPADLALASDTLRLSREAGVLSEGVAALRAAATTESAAASSRALWISIAEALRAFDAAGADEAYERALASGEDVALLGALVELRRGLRGRPLVDALLRLASAQNDAPDLLLEAARVSLDELHDAAQARQIARRLLALAAAGGRPWHELQAPVDWAIGALIDEGPVQVEAAQRVEVLRQGVLLPYETERRVELLRRAAALSEEPLHDLEAAIQGYLQLLQLAPADLGALGHLAQLYRRLGHRAELLDVLRRQIAAQGQPHLRTELRLDLAALLRDTGEADGAIQVLREALEDTPDSAPTIALLEQLYEATGRGKDLVALIEQQAGRAEGAAAAEPWARAAALAEARLADTARAVANHRRAAALGRAASLEALARLLLLRHEHAEAALVLEQIASQAEGEALVSAWARLAEAYVAAGRKDEARRVLEQAAAQAADPTPHQSRLVDLYREAGDWARLADMMIAEAKSTREPRLRAARLREAAELLLTRKGDAVNAAPLLQEAAELAPDDVLIQLAFGESLRQAGRLDQASEVLQRLIESYGSRRPKDRALAHLQMALVLQASGERSAALLELDVASRIDPAHPRILHALGQIAIEEGELDRAQKALRSLLLLLPRGARSEHGVARVEVQLGLADIARRQGDAARSDELIDSAFALARENESDLQIFEDGLRRRGLHASLVRSLEARLAAAPEPAQVGLLRELAAIYQQHLDQPAEALERLRRALPLAPEQPELRQEALALARSLGATGALASELAALARSLGEGSPEAALALWFELATLAESEPRDDAQAVAALSEAERLAPRLADSEATLRRIWPRIEAALLRQNDRPALVGLLRRRREFLAAHSLGEAEQAEPLFRLSELLLTPPAAPVEALVYLDEAIALDPQVDRAAALIERAVAAHGDDEQVLRFYERFSRDHGRPLALIDALRRLGALPSAGTASLRQAAELAIEHGEHDTADAVLREISELDQNPSSLPDVIWALVTLAQRVQARGDVSLAASLKERAADVAPLDERRRLLLDVATLSQQSLHDNARAARLYASLLESNPDDALAWRPLLDIYRATEDDARLAALLDRLLQIVDGETRASLRDDLINTLLRERAASPAESLQRAIALLQDALNDSPTDVSTAQRLAELLERTGDRAQLADLLERQLDAARERGDAPAVSALSLRLGALYEQLGDERRAADAYRVGLDFTPGHSDLLRALLTLAERRDDAAEITDVLERLLDVEKGPRAAEIALRLASLHDANWSPEAAERALERGYDAHPEPALRDQLVERYADSSAWAKLAALHARDASAQTATGPRVAALRKAAEVQRKHLANRLAAADLLQQALALAPTDRATLLALLDALASVPPPASTRRAIDALSFAIEQRPGDAELLRLRGERQASLGAFDAAVADLEASLAAGHAAAGAPLLAALRQAIPDARGPAAQRPLRLRLARLLAEAGDLDGAREQLDAATRAEPGNPDALRALADLERRAQRWDAALAPLKQLAAAADGPALLDLAAELAEVATRAERPADARPALERALRIDPRRKPLRDRLRALYEQLGLRQEQAALLREDASLATEPGPRFEALLAAARLLIDPQHGDAKLAAQTLDEARALRPDDLELALLLAETQVSLRRNREAIQVLDRVVNAHRGKRSRALGHVYQRKAQLELGLGERPAALASLVRAFDNDGANGQLGMELGLLALEMNDEQAATRAFRAITLMKTAGPSGDEGTSAASKAQAYYQLSLLALGQADRRKARLLAEKAVVEDPSLEPARILRDELKNG